MHWGVHWVWMLEDHQCTCLLLSLVEALVHQEMHLQHIHVDWVFSEPEGRVAGCPVLSLGLQESLPSRSRGVNQAHPPLAFADSASSSSLGLEAASHLGVPKDRSPGDPQVVARFQGPFHLSDIDQKVGRLEDSWMVEEFLMMKLVDLLVDIPVLVDIHHFLPNLYCTCHFQSLVDQCSGHIVLAMLVEDLLVLGSCYIQEHLVHLVDLHILHVLVGVVPGGMRGDNLVRVDRPFLDDVVEPVSDPRLEGSCCSWEGSQGQGRGNHLENCQ